MRIPIAASVTLLACAGCSPVDSTLERPDLDFNRMLDQPRYDPYGASTFFEDRAAMRRPPDGTVPWVGDEGSPPPSDFPLTRRLLERGRKRFDTVCATCHGVVGDGDTPVGERMELRPPPSLHTDKARSFSDEELREIVRQGYGLMPSYEQHFDRRDVWAVVHYLRALQLSQHAEVDELPIEAVDALREAVE